MSDFDYLDLKIDDLQRQLRLLKAELDDFRNKHRTELDHLERQLRDRLKDPGN